MPGVILSIIIVNWNGKRFLKGCFDSIYRQKVSSIEVIFVDNGSTDGSIEFVRERFSANRDCRKWPKPRFCHGEQPGHIKGKGQIYSYP